MPDFKRPEARATASPDGGGAGRCDDAGEFAGALAVVFGGVEGPGAVCLPVAGDSFLGLSPTDSEPAPPVPTAPNPIKLGINGKSWWDVLLFVAALAGAGNPLPPIVMLLAFFGVEGGSEGLEFANGVCDNCVCSDFAFVVDAGFEEEDVDETVFISP